MLNIIKRNTIINLLLIVGIMFIIVGLVGLFINHSSKKNTKIIYKYVPRTFWEEQESPIPVSDIFVTMFSEPSPWVSSIKTYDIEKQEKINKYFISQA